MPVMRERKLFTISIGERKTETMEIIPGLHLLKISSPTVAYAHLNVYVIQGNNGWLMIDTGWDKAEALESLETQLVEMGLGFRDISQILITHSHPDHYGSSGKVKDLSGATLALHEVEVNLLSSRFTNIQQFWDDMSRWMQANGTPDEDLPVNTSIATWMKDIGIPGIPDVILHDNDIVSTGIFNFRVIWTPGHSPGHVCLYESEKKILLSGDHVLPGISPNVGRGPWTGDNPLGDYLASLDELTRLDVDLVLPAHEEPFTECQQRICELRDHHEQRKTAMQKVLNNGAKTAYEVASEVMWTKNRKEVTLSELCSMDKRMALWETLAHLELLRVEGNIEQLSQNDIILHRACK